MLAYPRVLAAAVLCYAALGAVLRIIPTRLHDLGAGAVAIGFAVGAPALTGAIFRPAGGRLADRIGPRRVLVAGAIGMAVGVAPGVVPDVTAQVGSRLLVGAGEGLMMSAGVLWLLRLGGPERRGRALGHIGLANYGGLAIGPAGSPRPCCVPGSVSRSSTSATWPCSRSAPSPPPTVACKARRSSYRSSR